MLTSATTRRVFPQRLGSACYCVALQVSAAKCNLTLLRTVVAPAWIPVGNNRGSSEIIWSCLLTLTASIFDAIHLNVPRGHETVCHSLLTLSHSTTLQIKSGNCFPTFSLFLLFRLEQFLGEITEQLVQVIEISREVGHAKN